MCSPLSPVHEQRAPWQCLLSGGDFPRRYRETEDKPFKCQFPGCNSSYLESRNLRAHENMKHGRKKKYSRTPSGALIAGYGGGMEMELPLSASSTNSPGLLRLDAAGAMMVQADPGLLSDTLSTWSTQEQGSDNRGGWQEVTGQSAEGDSSSSDAAPQTGVIK